MEFQNAEGEKNLRTSRIDRKQAARKVSGIRMKSDFPTAMLKARQWSHVFKIMTKNDLQLILSQTNNLVRVEIYIQNLQTQKSPKRLTSSGPFHWKLLFDILPQNRKERGRSKKPGI